ncbi:DNA primase family protein [Nesterenkonia halotolerans]|uniref:DNA primase/helicase n=1 Tax=Nesterenkonia halotolerans TaxID=225325 RepID=A0ABR9J5N5_9MICC|nr:phage/plasmid primase, P4 family [Nesterenkonia halotolerans]MBE1514309.1 putative DNA primase/helicase [Nesterenkonia halotolerans]
MSPFYADPTEESTSPAADLVSRIEAAAELNHPTAPTAQKQRGTAPTTPDVTTSSNILGGVFMPLSEETIVEMETHSYLESIKDQDVGLRQIRDHLLNRISKAFSREQARRDGDKQLNGGEHPKLVKPKVLDELTCAQVLLARYPIAGLDFANGQGDEDRVELSIWSPPPADANKSDCDHGIYATGSRRIKQLIHELKPSASANAVKSMLATLKAHAPIKEITRIPHLRAVNNGVFNHETKELEPFTPDYVAVHKIPMNYNPDAEDPEITMHDGEKWTFSTWLEGLTDDEGVYELLWEGIAAAVWPYYKRNKALFLHSERGNNGKGAYCQVIDNLLGLKGAAAIPLASFGQRFALSSLLHAQAIIAHENPVGAFSDDLKDFKTVATGDKFSLERKNEHPLEFVFVGPIFQCVNDFPKTRDKSDSFARRQLWIPFRKWFGGKVDGEDVERSYIKDEYLARNDVLEYVLKEALHMPLAKFSEPQACLDLLEEAKRENNAVREFWHELEDEFVWDLLPTPFLFDLFISWFKKNNPSGLPVGRSTFISSLSALLFNSDKWDYEDKDKKHRPGQKMIEPELLITEYDLKDWMNANYVGSNPAMRSAYVPNRVHYRGVLRRNPASSAKGPEDAVDTDAAVSD